MLTNWKRVGVIAAAAALAGTSLLAPREAQAHGRGGFRGRAWVGGFYGFGPYWGFGYGWGPYFGPYFAPYAYRPAGGIDMGMAMMAGFGAVDVNVKPNRAEVWVDGKYIAEARDLDGYPSYLWLKEGPHHVVIYKGGHQRFEEDVEARPGIRTELKVRLEEGPSEPPGRKPGEAK